MRTSIKILLLTVTSFLFVENVLRAQSWTAASPNIYFTGGNVGIGATAPPTLLSIRQTTASHQIFSICRANSDVPAIYLGNQATTDNGIISSNGAGLLIGTSTSGTFTERVRLDYTTGNVGIGTTSPLAKLHLNNGSLLFDGTTGATPTSGAGTRMMWIPTKAAFRAGTVTGTEWNDVSIGTNSFAFGYNAKASGGNSVAMGAGSIATGEYSFAFNWANASGDNSFATGYNTTASGTFSSTFGSTTTASGGASAAFGYNTTAQSYGSLVVGRYNTIAGNGGSWVATDPLFVIGNGASAVAASNALTVFKNGKTLIENPNLAGFMGTPDGYLLFVQQGILAEKVKVAVATTAYWSDYVFDEQYKLKSIEDLESFVKTNKHLPNIPSAEEVVKNGIDMATMDARLLEKIEELSLYIIQQNKRIEALEKKALYKK